MQCVTLQDENIKPMEFTSFFKTVWLPRVTAWCARITGQYWFLLAANFYSVPKSSLKTLVPNFDPLDISTFDTQSQPNVSLQTTFSVRAAARNFALVPRSDEPGGRKSSWKVEPQYIWPTIKQVLELHLGSTVMEIFDKSGAVLNVLTCRSLA
jgi:hypothetical protein